LRDFDEIFKESYGNSYRTFEFRRHVFLEEDSFTLVLVPEKAKEGTLKLKFQNFLKFFPDILAN